MDAITYKTIDIIKCNFQYKITCQFAQNSFVVGAPPRTPLGELTTLPQTP
jgi:hypothetical protein